MRKLTLAEYITVSGSAECAGWDTAALRAFCAWLVDEQVYLPQTLTTWERCHLMWARGSSHSAELARVLQA